MWNWVGPKKAVGLSLFIEGAAALIGTIQRFRTGEIHFKARLKYIISGMADAAGAHDSPLSFP
jgi:uncharacterized membrane protein YfcA